MKKILIFISLFLLLGLLSSCGGGSTYTKITLKYNIGGKKTTDVIDYYPARGGGGTIKLNGKAYVPKSHNWTNVSEVTAIFSRTLNILKYSWDSRNILDYWTYTEEYKSIYKKKNGRLPYGSRFYNNSYSWSVDSGDNTNYYSCSRANLRYGKKYGVIGTEELFCYNPKGKSTGKSIKVFKKHNGSGINFKSGDTIKLRDSGAHTLYIAYYHTVKGRVFTDTINVGTYRLDKNPPSLNVSTSYNIYGNKTNNLGYRLQRGRCLKRSLFGGCRRYEYYRSNWSNTAWTKNDISVRLLTSDNESGLKYSKYGIDKRHCGWGSYCKTFNNGDYVTLNIEGKHYLYMYAKDKAGNNSRLYSGYYKIDKTPPTVDVDNKDYSWKKSNINIKIKAFEKVNNSGLRYAKYIWDYEGGASKCIINGHDFRGLFFSRNYYTPSKNIVLSKEGEHTLYLCAKDYVGWESGVKSFGPYKLDKTKPTIILNIPNSKKAGDNNFVVNFKLYDNLNQINNSIASFDKIVKYSYKIEADQSKESLNKTLSSGGLKTDTYSLTNASEKGEVFKIKFDFEDKAGNIGSLVKNFVIYPDDLDQTKTIISLNGTTGTKFANNKDFYSYNLQLEDKYGNYIYDKKITKIENLDDIWKDYLIEFGDYETNKADDEGKITFKLKSYFPFDSFKQKFSIKMKKWNDSYNNVSGNYIITKEVSGDNLFKKPVDVSLEAVEIPQIGREQEYVIKLNNIGNLNTSTETNIENGKILLINSNFDSIIKNNISGHYWNNKTIIHSSFANNLSTTNLKFKGKIDARDNYLEAPSINIDGLKINYKFHDGNKEVTYIMNTNGSDVTGGASCTIETLGAKIYGDLQGNGKSVITGQKANISDLSKSDLRGKIRTDAYKIISGLEIKPGENINGVVYYNGGNIKYSDVIDKLNENDTVVIKNGNFVFDKANSDEKTIGIIVLKDAYDVLDDYANAGNIYVNDNVENLDAIIYADGVFRSANEDGNSYTNDLDLEKRLKLKGSLFTRNTIGGAVVGASEFVLPGGKTTTDFSLAEKYDLNYIRKVPILCDGSTNDGYSFIIKYNPKIQNNPPRLF